MSEDNKIKTEEKINQDGESTMSRADHHKHLDEKYPTKRGFWDVMAKNGFLLLTHIFCDMKCIGRENFPKNNPYVVASTPRATSSGCAASQLPTLRPTTAVSAASSCVSAEVSQSTATATP